MLYLWGSNARETHPIFFHHVLKGLRRGARMFAVDPRRTSSAEWADEWMGIEVGSDIALANGIAHVILRDGLENRRFIEHATSGFAAYEARRRRRVERIVAAGARGSSAKIPGRVGRVFQESVLRLVFGVFVTDRSVAWMTDYRVSAEVTTPPARLPRSG